MLHVLPSGSGALYFRGLARYFDRARFDWHFLTLEREERELLGEGVEIHGLGARGLLRAGLGLSRLLRSELYHIVHLHLFPSLVAGGIARLLGCDPLVIASHHYGREPFLYRRNYPAQWMERGFCRRLDHVIAVSQDIADYLRDEIGVPPERMSLIHYGYDFDDLPRDPEVPKSNGSFVVGSVARLHWTKGHEYLLRALARLKHEDRIDVRLILLGAGPEEDALKALARRLEIEAEVSFLGHQRDPLPYYRAMDVFCHPSLQKGYEQVTIEAMALGKAIVATPVGIAREVVRDGENGIVIAERDSEAIHGALLRLSRDACLRRALGERAARDVRQLIPSREEMTRRYEDLYLRLRSSARDARATLETYPKTHLEE